MTFDCLGGRHLRRFFDCLTVPWSPLKKGGTTRQ